MPRRRCPSTALTAVCLVIGIAPGCPEPGEPGDDLDAPAVALAGLSAYQFVLGTAAIAVEVEDDVGVDHVDLLVDGEVEATSAIEPFTLSWDTTASEVGPAEVAARAFDASGRTADSEPVPVVVINGGAEATLAEGETGAIVVPEDHDGSQDLAVVRHWTAAPPVSRIIGVVTWADEARGGPWTLDLAAGIGQCPDTGEQMGETVTASSSPALIDLTVEDAPPSEQWFLHVSPANPADHRGESLALCMAVATF